MAHRKLSEEEKSQMRSESMAGTGIFIFENKTNSEIKLPRPTKSGQTEVLGKQQFQGDSYYIQLVQQGLCKLVKVIQSPDEAKLLEAKKMEEEQKLLLEQPDIVTGEGKVEYVVAKPTPPKKKVNETKKVQAPQPDVLLNENAPVCG